MPVNIDRLHRMIDNGRHATVRVHLDGEAAAELLKRNRHNRPKKFAAIDQYHQDMVSDRWTFNGEAIKFDICGDLIDGQNRLFALEKTAGTGLLVETLVICGLEQKAQLTMDQGARRSPSDQLGLTGVVASDSTTAAALRVLMSWERKLLFGDVKTSRITTPELIDWAKDHDTYISLICEARASGYGKIPMRPSVALAISAKLLSVDSDAAYNFLTPLSNGLNLVAGNPAAALRARLGTFKDSKRKVSDRELIALTVNAWNLYREGRRVSKIQSPRGGWNRDNFPLAV